MFTGIIEHFGTLINFNFHEHGAKAFIKTPCEDLKLGESIAVDGICLTVSTIQESYFFCDLSTETLSCSTSKNWQIGKVLNLERALKVGDRMGGHIVSGHVDTIAKITHFEPQEKNYYCEIELPPEAKNLVVDKGSITINGVSLTINKVLVEELAKSAYLKCALMLIPHTLNHTNLQYLEVGSFVNIEYDYLARYVAQYLKFTSMPV